MLISTTQKHLRIPHDYAPKLSLRETEIAIKKLKDFFEQTLASELNLTRVSAPLFVQPQSGLNDDLNGIERPVSFDISAVLDGYCEIVHSLAKWKRLALKRYGFTLGEGLYTDMNAIRRDEQLDNLHSLYVDQWDWERIIDEGDRSMPFLEQSACAVYRCFLKTADYIGAEFPCLTPSLPDSIYFVSSQELEDRYPHLSPAEREDAVTQEHGAVFISNIGDRLLSGARHDGRAPDYDDWSLNGDILFWYPPLEQAIELSSMGIRVDPTALKRQLEAAGCPERASLPFHSELLHGRLPLTIGGGIGQSRLCLFFLEKVHIGEVQASVWPADMIAECESHRVDLL